MVERARKLAAEAAQLEPAEIDPALPLASQQQWDSLCAVRLVVRLESLIGRELSEEEIVGIESIPDIATLLTKSGT